MNVLREFDIEFIKLKEGEHRFEFHVGDAFFKAFNSSLTAQDIAVSLLFIKSGSMFTLVFDFDGKLETDCDRCLSSIGIPVNGRHTLLVKITEHPKENEDDLIYLSAHDYKLNVAQHIYDFINLSIPIKKTCTDIGLECDPAVTEKINSVIDVELADDDAADLPEWNTDDEEE